MVSILERLLKRLSESSALLALYECRVVKGTETMLNFKLSFFALMIVAAMTNVGCSDSGSTAENHDASAQAAGERSMKAAAEAEAAEEEFAKNKSKRGVASVKGSRKKSAAESIYIVQVGIFKIEANANKMEAKLKSAGLPVFQKKIERDGATFYAVRIEPTPNRVEAEKFVSSIKAATGESSLILSVGR